MTVSAEALARIMVKLLLSLLFDEQPFAAVFILLQFCQERLELKCECVPTLAEENKGQSQSHLAK